MLYLHNGEQGKKKKKILVDQIDPDIDRTNDTRHDGTVRVYTVYGITFFVVVVVDMKKNSGSRRGVDRHRNVQFFQNFFCT